MLKPTLLRVKTESVRPIWLCVKCTWMKILCFKSERLKQINSHLINVCIIIKYFLHHQYQALSFWSFLVVGIEGLLFLFLMQLVSSTFRFVFIEFSRFCFKQFFSPTLTTGFNNFRVFVYFSKEHRLRSQ